MTPNEVYLLPIQDFVEQRGVVPVLLGGFSNHCHIPEFLPDKYTSAFDHEERYTDRITIRIHKFIWNDVRRYWRLASVWVDGMPVMVIRNAGREGDDFADRIITDLKRYELLLEIVGSLRSCKREDGTQSVDPDVNIKDLESFYGQSIRTVGRGI